MGSQRNVWTWLSGRLVAQPVLKSAWDRDGRGCGGTYQEGSLKMSRETRLCPLQSGLRPLPHVQSFFFFFSCTAQVV